MDRAPLIELVMVFALGFLVSGLLTLLFLPAFWRRAVRLSTRRLEMQMPLSMDEIVAERDQLRAVFATEHRQLEQKSEALREARAKERVELGRRATAITNLETALADVKADFTRAQADLSARNAELAAALTDIGALNQAHWGAIGQSEARARTLAALEEEHSALANIADERRVAIANLQTRMASLEMELEDLRRRREAGRQASVETVLAAEKAIEERDALRLEAASATARRDALQMGADEQNQRIAELERAHRAERRARLHLEAEAASTARALAEAAEREKMMRADLARQLEGVGPREHELHQQIEDLRVERSALEGALDVTRREYAALRAQRAALPGASDEDAAQLRKSIAEIGDEVSLLVKALQDEAEEKARAGAPLQAVGERVRALQARAKRIAPTH